MSLTAISSLESARRKFFMNSTQNMCKNLESNVLGLRRPNWNQLARIGRKFFIGRRTCVKTWTVFGLRRQK